MTTTRSLLLVALLSLSGGEAARAQQPAPGPTRILVLEPASRYLPKAKLRRLARHLRQLVARYPALELVRGPKADLRLLRIRARCRNFRPACLSAMGRAARAARVLYTRIGALPGRFLVEMQLLDVASGRVLDKNRQPCRRRLDSVRNALWKGWVALQGPLVKSQLKVSANVSGAEVLLDGRPVGRTPLVLTKQLARGRHQIEVRHPGWAPVRKQVEVKGAEGVTLDVRLSRLAAVEPVPKAAVAAAPEGGKLAGGKEDAAAPAGAGPAGAATAAQTARPAASAEPQPAGAAGKTTASGPTLARRPPTTAAGTTEPPSRADARGSGSPGPLAVTDLGRELSAPPPEPEPRTRWWRSWWFWTAVGAVAAAATTTGIVLGMRGASIPAGHGRVTLDF